MEGHIAEEILEKFPKYIVDKIVIENDSSTNSSEALEL